jgi:hypothetical protein
MRQYVGPKPTAIKNGTPVSNPPMHFTPSQFKEGLNEMTF